LNPQKITLEQALEFVENKEAKYLESKLLVYNSAVYILTREHNRNFYKLLTPIEDAFY
jgi:hypothetical protein